MAKNDDEAALERLESLAALGQLAAGVTHEVRNAMTGIVGFLQVARKKSADAELEQLLALVESESQRCIEVLKQFLAFSRPLEGTRAPVDLRAAIERVARLTRHRLGLQQIRIDVEVEGSPPPIVADAAALQQVLLNLVLNAMQALDGRSGRVTLALRDGGDGTVVLQVRDDGPGVPAELAARIFEPFFSTKPAGQGTGLGLAVSRTLIEQHGGSLSLERTATGATFTIRLPAQRAA